VVGYAPLGLRAEHETPRVHHTSRRRGSRLAALGARAAAGDAGGRQIQFLNASTSREIEAAFATLVRDRADALFVAPDGLFVSRAVQFATLAARHGIPAAYPLREVVEVGGLMSYGTDLVDAYRQTGVYTGQILKGAKPVDLLVLQSTKFELIINLRTAKALGLTVPDTLLARADEVIE
jgi:putative tryptophan/tyrosine transport system substrate-binding protein